MEVSVIQELHAVPVRPDDVVGACLDLAAERQWQVLDGSGSRFFAVVPGWLGAYWGGSRVAVEAVASPEVTRVRFASWSVFTSRGRLRKDSAPLRQALGLGPTTSDGATRRKRQPTWVGGLRTAELAVIPLFAATVYAYHYWRGAAAVYLWLVLLPVIFGFDLGCRRALNVPVRKDLLLPLVLASAWGILLAVLVILAVPQGHF
jgi:hypothetical protein